MSAFFREDLSQEAVGHILSPVKSVVLYIMATFQSCVLLLLADEGHQPFGTKIVLFPYGVD